MEGPLPVLSLDSPPVKPGCRKTQHALIKSMDYNTQEDIALALQDVTPLTP